MDENVTLKDQLEENVSAVILLNKFTVSPGNVDQFLKVFTATTEFCLTSILGIFSIDTGQLK